MKRSIVFAPLVSSAGAIEDARDDIMHNQDESNPASCREVDVDNVPISSWKEDQEVRVGTTCEWAASGNMHNDLICFAPIYAVYREMVGLGFTAAPFNGS